MNDRLDNERLFKKARRENLLGVGETRRGESALALRAKPSIPPLTFVVVTVLDLIGLFVALTVSAAGGLIMLVISSAILGLWMSLRLGATRRQKEEKG
jgi:hypothetical protein